MPEQTTTVGFDYDYRAEVDLLVRLDFDALHTMWLGSGHNRKSNIGVRLFAYCCADASEDWCGCPTQVKAFIRPAKTEELTEFIRSLDGLPRDINLIRDKWDAGDYDERTKLLEDFVLAQRATDLVLSGVGLDSLRVPAKG